MSDLKVIEELRVRGELNDVLVLSIFKQGELIDVDLDLIRNGERFKLAQTHHKTEDGARSFFNETAEMIKRQYNPI